MLIAIGIGGTGAKCLEALVHLCASGSGLDRIMILVIDPDESNGNLGRLKRTITMYNKCWKLMHPEREIFYTEIVPATEGINWSPVQKYGINLSEYIQYPTLKIRNEKLADLCDLLYSQAELKQPWNRGFWGHTSLGAPVMAKIGNELNEKPWSVVISGINDDLNSGRKARIFILASIFGATGASGFPVVARILRDRFPNQSNLKIGGALLLPYFKFADPQPGQSSGIYSDYKDFLLKSKAALKHYESMWAYGMSPYDALYLIGDQSLDDMEGENKRSWAPGGPEQTNYAHYVELLAALAAIEFHNLHAGETANQGATEHALARQYQKTVNWGDLPNEAAKKQMANFVALALAYRTFYYPFLTYGGTELRRRFYVAPWYVDHFMRKGIRLLSESEGLQNIDEYMLCFLDWLYQLHYSSQNTVNLFNRTCLSECKKAGYRNLSDDLFTRFVAGWGDPRLKNGFDELWRRLCEVKVDWERSPVSAPGKFLHLLYQGAKSFCDANYA